jgi:hypothetical protein
MSGERYFKCEECGDYCLEDEVMELDGEEYCISCYSDIEQIAIAPFDHPAMILLNRVLRNQVVLKELEKNSSTEFYNKYVETKCNTAGVAFFVIREIDKIKPLIHNGRIVLYS